MRKTRRQSLTITPNFYWSVGFILARHPQLVAFIPPKAKADFWDRYREATGQEPHSEMSGLILHDSDSNKYWHECRITYKATERENLRLFLSYDIIVSSNNNDYWNINWNVLFFELLSLGFKLGSKQDLETVKTRIPGEHQATFLDGYNKGLGNGEKNA